MARQHTSFVDRGRHHEAVAAPVPGLDVMRVPGVVAERASQLLNTRRERVVADRHAAPDAIEQVLLGDELLGPLGQLLQHGGSPRRELDLAAVAPKLPGSRVKTKQAKSELPVIGHAPARLRISRKFPGTPPVLPGLPWHNLSHAAVGAAMRRQTP